MLVPDPIGDICLSILSCEGEFRSFVRGVDGGAEVGSSTSGGMWDSKGLGGRVGAPFAQSNVR